MKQFTKVLIVLFAFSPLLKACITQNDKTDNSKNTAAGPVIAGYTVASDSILRTIPKEYIDKARNTLHVAYQHTSHGTHVVRGMFGLPEFKAGDDVLFGITNDSAVTDKLDFHDLAMGSYADPGMDASDLSLGETAFINATRKYLNDPKNKDINVLMWSWCNIGGHDVAGNYLPGMDSLIAEYGRNGSKIGSGEGQRQNPVTFIFMTGHANQNENVGDGNPKNQAQLILDYCLKNNQYCLDYYSIDTHDMLGNYWEDAGDDGNSTAYGGQFYNDWQNAHQKGIDWYENKLSPAGDIETGAHNTQHITANRKAYAMWWILARIAGWDGQ